MILVKKKDGIQSFAVDCRELNDSSKYEASLIRDASDIFDRLGGSIKETGKELTVPVSI